MNLKNISLHFRDSELEKLFINHQLKCNMTSCKKLLYFNFLIYFMLSFLFYFKHNIVTIPIFSLCYLPILSIVFFLYSRDYPHKNYLQIIYLIFSILIPLIFGTIFLVDHLNNDLCNGSVAAIDLYIFGYSFATFKSYFMLFKMQWYWVSFMKLMIGSFLVIYQITITNSYQELSVIVAILVLFTAYFDYKNDESERRSYYTEYLFAQNFENLKKIFEEIPDFAIIWKKQGLSFANKSTLKFFRQNDLNSLQKVLINRIELQELQSPINDKNDTEINLNNSNFLEKVLEVLNSKNGFMTFQSFVGNIKVDTKEDSLEDLQNYELDIKIKKIYWEKDVSVMILLTRVDEIHIKNRLDFVNSFLTKVLGQFSHDMYTPLHIILSITERIKSQIKDIKLIKELQIAKNTEQILLNMIKIMIDIFHIRKGSLLLEITRINIDYEINEILLLFEEILIRKRIKVIFESYQIHLNTDSNRFRQVMVVLLNKAINQMESGEIEISVTSVLKSKPQLLKITVEVKANNDLKITNEASCSLISYVKYKPLSEPQFHFNFSMIDYIILCLSCGHTENLERNSLLRSSDELLMPSQVKYWFEICSVENQEKVRIKDPFKDNFHFELNFRCSFTDESFISNIESNEHQVFRKSQNSNLSIEKNNIVKLEMPSKFSPLRKTINNISVLNVDDVYYSLLVISSYCKSNNLHVEEAKNGLEALNKVKDLYNKEKKIIDIIFMDCDMPIMNGFEAAEKINEFHKNMNLKEPNIIAVTANVANEEILSKFQISGMKEMVQKPLSIDRFRELLKKYLNF